MWKKSPHLFNFSSFIVFSSPSSPPPRGLHPFTLPHSTSKLLSPPTIKLLSYPHNSSDLALITSSKRFAILTDCRFAALSPSSPCSHDSIYAHTILLIHRLVRTLQDMGIQLLFHWIPGHCGHPLGDRVDLLAKAFSTDTSLSSIPCPLVPTPLALSISFIKTRYKSWISQLWWTNCNLISPTSLFLAQPNRSKLPPILQLIQNRPIRTIRTIYRLLLGVPTDNKFLHRCKVSSSTSCSFCSHSPDSSAHRILHCAHYDSFRSTAIGLLQLLDTPVLFTISSLLHLADVDSDFHQEVADIFCDFLEQTRLVHLFLYNSKVHNPPSLPSSTPPASLLPLRQSPLPSSSSSYAS